MMTLKAKLALSLVAVGLTAAGIVTAHELSKKKSGGGGGGGGGAQTVADNSTADDFDPNDVLSDQGVKVIGDQPVGAPREDDPDWAVARVYDPASGYSVPVDENGVAKGYVDDPNHAPQKPPSKNGDGPPLVTSSASSYGSSDSSSSSDDFDASDPSTWFG